MKLARKPRAFLLVCLDQFAARQRNHFRVGCVIAEPAHEPSEWNPETPERVAQRYGRAACQSCCGAAREGSCMCVLFCTSDAFSVASQVLVKSVLAETQPAVLLSNREWQRVRIVVQPSC